MTERREHDDGDGGMVALDAARNVEHIVVVGTRHADNQVGGKLVHLLFRLFLVGGADEARGIAQTEGGIFLKYLFLHAPVILQHEHVIRVGDDEHIENAAHHELDKWCVAQLHLFVYLVIHGSFSPYFL